MPTIEQLESISIDRAFDIYQERFADASDFTFALVGNFEVEKIKPLLATYLGNLPSIKREEQWKDIGADLKKGRIEKTIVRGKRPNLWYILPIMENLTMKLKIATISTLL